MKKSRLIIALSLMVQSVTFFVLFFVYADRKKNLSRVFLGCGAASFLGGSFLLFKELKAKRALKKLQLEDPCYGCEEDCSNCPEALFEEDDNLNCSFVDDDAQELKIDEE